MKNSKRELDFDGDVVALEDFLSNISLPADKDTLKGIDFENGMIEAGLVVKERVVKEVTEMMANKRPGSVPCWKLTIVGAALKEIGPVPKGCIISTDIDRNCIVVAFKGDK